MCIRDSTNGAAHAAVASMMARWQDCPTIQQLHDQAHVRPPVSYTHLRAHETVLDLVCRLLLEKKKRPQYSVTLYAHTLIQPLPQPKLITLSL